MSPLLAALLFAVALWWLGTGVVLYLQQRLVPREGAGVMNGTALAIGTAAALAVVALLWSGGTGGAASSLIAFAAAIVLWGTLELSHYLGLVTGTHERRCPVGARGWRRFRLALGTSIWHELSVLGAGLMLTTLLWSAENPAGLYTFLVLWLMRWSAKLNLFLGVPNFSTEWFPARLSHLASYVRHAPVSVLYPVSLTLAALAVVQLVSLAVAAGERHALVHALPAALLLLAVVEHVFMALPFADTRLWNRVFGLREAATEPSTPPSSSRSTARSRSA